MKILITSLLLLSSLSFYSQNEDCLDFHNGKFLLKDELTGDTYITRKDGIQTEVNKSLDFSARFKIVWVNDCTYTLELIEIISDPTGPNLPPDTVLRNVITETNGNKAKIRTTIDGIDFTMDFELIKLE